MIKKNLPNQIDFNVMSSIVCINVIGMFFSSHLIQMVIKYYIKMKI